jgi:cell wall-associated NlpC family hydrolase
MRLHRRCSLDCSLNIKMITIEPYKHVPFQERGRSHAGIDCWGLVYLIHREQLGSFVPAYDGAYECSDDREEIAALIRKERELSWAPVPADRVQEGDVVVLRILGEPWHCGVMLDKTMFVHIERNALVVRESIESMRWAKRIEGFYRWNP